MNLVDGALILVILLAVWSGWYRGFIAGVLDLINWLGSLLAGFLFYPYTAAWLERVFSSVGAWKLPIAFIITVLLARIIIGFITGSISSGITARTNNSAVNRFLGIAPGFINGIIYASVIAALLLSLPLTDGINTETRNSKIANTLSAKLDRVNEKLSPLFDKAIDQTINNLVIHPKSNETVTLPFKNTSPKVRSDLEAAMLRLVNDERTRRGLSPLKPDTELTPVARAHSEDMFARGYFSHVTPEGKDPFDRMSDAHIRYLAAGENLALAQSLSIAHNGLMESRGHRANILSSSFGRVGIGILDGGKYGLMISQEFRD